MTTADADTVVAKNFPNVASTVTPWCGKGSTLTSTTSCASPAAKDSWYRVRTAWARKAAGHTRAVEERFRQEPDTDRCRADQGHIPSLIRKTHGDPMVVASTEQTSNTPPKMRYDPNQTWLTLVLNELPHIAQHRERQRCDPSAAWPQQDKTNYSVRRECTCS